MSWQDKIKQPYSITTGDGAKFTPMWSPRTSVVLVQEFNIAAFNFKGIRGTLVDRGEVRGNIYDIEVVFTGKNHLDVALDFRNSAKDKRPWTISHPYYGLIHCHPAVLKYNNEEGNITKVTGQILETLGGANLAPAQSPYDKILIDKLAIDTALAQTYLSEVPEPAIADIKAMSGDIETFEEKVSLKVKLSEDFNKLKNFINRANYYIATASTYPAQAIQAIQSVISAPADFIDSEANRLQMLYDSMVGFYDFAKDLSLLPAIPYTIRKLYEHNAGSCINNMCLSAVTNIDGEYTTRPSVLATIQFIANAYNEYIGNLDTLQAANGGVLDGYIPDVDSINLLSALVNYTVSQLLVISAGAKQEIVYTLPENDNVTTLAKTLYGSSSDANMDKLISDNNINYRELLQLRKGRQIVYYA